MADLTYLEIGENHLHNDKYNKTEKVILESLENKWKSNGFRIIHATPISKKNMAVVDIQIEYNEENLTSSGYWSDLVYFYITSRKNSPGATFYKWKDGKHLKITMNKNVNIKYNIQPRMFKYLEETPFRNKRSTLNLMLKRKASKFTIF